MMSDAQEQRNIIDEERLRLLEIFYYVAGGSKVLYALFPLLYVFMGVFLIVLSSVIPQKAHEPSPAIFGWILIGMGVIASALIGALAAAQIYAGRCIHKRQRRTVCFIIAAFSCLSMPWGIALGVFTFLVLGSDSVGNLFKKVTPRAEMGAP